VGWTIQWVEVLPDDDNGITVDSERTIKIKTKDATEPFLRQCLIHEVLHACCFAVGGHWPSEEEHAVRLLERPAMSLFDDERNAGLIRWLRRND
jgi:hypothetical protein